MQRLIVLVLLAALGWYGYNKYQHQRVAQRAIDPSPSPAAAALSPPTPTTTETGFKCDGRTYCSQMTSCAEATYFLKNCPGVKMDGNNTAFRVSSSGASGSNLSVRPHCRAGA